MDAIVIGRHKVNTVGDYAVIAQHNVTFPENAKGCIPVLEALFKEAVAKNAALLFQSLPAQVAAALISIAVRNAPTHISVGAIASKSAGRPTGVTSSFMTDVFKDEMTPSQIEFYIRGIVHLCNPNAKVSGNQITVDPPMQFEFSHIEWLFF